MLLIKVPTCAIIEVQNNIIIHERQLTYNSLLHFIQL